MHSLHDLNDILNALIDFMNNLSILEQSKLDAVLDKNIERLDECMRKQQAQILRLRGLDQKREKIQRELGFQNMTLRQIIYTVNNNSILPMEQFIALDRATKTFYDLNDTTKKAIELNLHLMDKSNMSHLQDGTVFRNNTI